ncbi:hypothetical protein FWH09_03370 [Candidatus Saccharibacteria bacterium]|nr:hypothetical protein [Candidatus Saccharibacteria bacterium]
MRKYKVIMDSSIKPAPQDFEISAAQILANYFKGNAKMIPRTSMKTPDVEICGIEWEIKSPTGHGKRNIQHQIANACKQSRNIVIDARRSKRYGDNLMRELQNIYKTSKRIKRLLLVTKSGKVIEFKK